MNGKKAKKIRRFLNQQLRGGKQRGTVSPLKMRGEYTLEPIHRGKCSYQTANPYQTIRRNVTIPAIQIQGR